MNQHFYFGDFASASHAQVNDLYDKYLPYKFHLEMVVANAHKYIELVVPKNVYPDGDYDNRERNTIRHIIYCACWGHDLIENARLYYWDIHEVVRVATLNQGGFDDAVKIATQVSDIIYAVTNHKGKNRAERESDKYFEYIRNTEYATFVKTCDRMANVRYNKMISWRDDSKLRMYQKEHLRFKEQLCSDKYLLMFNEMDSLLR